MSAGIAERRCYPEAHAWQGVGFFAFFGRVGLDYFRKDPNIVFAGTHDGVYRSTDRGKTFKRANFPDKGMQIWSFLVDAGDPKLVYAGGSPVAVYRSEDSGETWKKLPDPPGMPLGG